MITKEELAEKLNGRQYGKEMTKTEEQEAKDAGLVVIFGQSDDLVEFCGAINDEIDFYHGGTIYLDQNGIIKNDCENEDCPYFQEKLQDAKQILAVWGDDSPNFGGVQGYSWSFRAVDFPNAAMFDILDGEEKYCRGFIFSMDEL